MTTETGSERERRINEIITDWNFLHPEHDAMERIDLAIEHFDFVLQELRAAQEKIEWRPIATAPKMRKIIVHYLNALGKHRTVMACYYEDNALEMADDYTDVGIYDEATGNCFAPAGWYEEHDSDYPVMPLQEEPDLWMPLPTPPSE